MKIVLLAGGFGTRISEESHLKPKPMIEIGGQPILWHIMKMYSYYGFNEFIVCCGYKSHIIKDYFSNYFLYNSDVTFDFKNDNKVEINNNTSEPWKVTLVETGLNTMTGGRLKRVQKYLNDETFMLTYGDGVSDVNIKELLEFHKKNGKIGTLTTTNIIQRFGVLEINDDSSIDTFREKSLSDGNMINGGFMVFEPDIFDYIDGDKTILEKEPLEKLVGLNELMAFKHMGFWQCMDTKRDMDYLEELLKNNKAPWKKWS